MNTLVLCSDITLGWCVPGRQQNDYPLAILERLRVSSAVVPAVWPHEVGDLLLEQEKSGRIKSADTLRFLELLGKLPITVQPDQPQRTLSEVLALARESGLSVTAAAYLDLAIRKGLPLATQRQDLCHAARALGRSIA